MTYNQMQDVLEVLNKKWNLDFVSATSGNCCNSCGEQPTYVATQQYEEADTYLVVKWFYAGMNHYGGLEEKTGLDIGYNVPKGSIESICKDLEEALEGRYTIAYPKNDFECIYLGKIA